MRENSVAKGNLENTVGSLDFSSPRGRSLLSVVSGASSILVSGTKLHSIELSEVLCLWCSGSEPPTARRAPGQVSWGCALPGAFPG